MSMEIVSIPSPVRSKSSASGILASHCSFDPRSEDLDVSRQAEHGSDIPSRSHGAVRMVKVFGRSFSLKKPLLASTERRANIKNLLRLGLTIPLILILPGFLMAIITFFHKVNHIAVLLLTGIAEVLLAYLLGVSTLALSEHINVVLAGILMALLGNLPDAIFSAIFMEQRHLIDLRNELLGSVFSNGLCVLGVALFVGGLRNHEQIIISKTASNMFAYQTVMVIAFIWLPGLMRLSSPSAVSSLSASRFDALAALFALSLSLIFQYTHRHDLVSSLSLLPTRIESNEVAKSRHCVWLMPLQLCRWLWTRRPTDSSVGDRAEVEGSVLSVIDPSTPPAVTSGLDSEASILDITGGASFEIEIESSAETPSTTTESLGGREVVKPLSRAQALALLVFVVAATTVVSVPFVDVIEDLSVGLGWPQAFITGVILPTLDNAAACWAAAYAAWQRQPDLAISISMGSMTQIALGVYAAMILIAWMEGIPLQVEHSTFDMVWIAFLAVSFAVIRDRRINYYPGFILILIYSMWAYSKYLS